MAEREGFEPSVPLLAAHTISSRAPSANSDISPKKIETNFYIKLRSNFIGEKNVGGGRGEIRTRGRHTPSTAFEAAAFNHSATLPFEPHLSGAERPDVILPWVTKSPENQR